VKLWSLVLHEICYDCSSREVWRLRLLLWPAPFSGHGKSNAGLRVCPEHQAGCKVFGASGGLRRETKESKRLAIEVLRRETILGEPSAATSQAMVRSTSSSWQQHKSFGMIRSAYDFSCSRWLQDLRQGLSTPAPEMKRRQRVFSRKDTSRQGGKQQDAGRLDPE